MRSPAVFIGKAIVVPFHGVPVCLFPSILHGGKDGCSRVDLVLSCVDNFAARLCINTACCELNQVRFLPLLRPSLCFRVL